MAEAIKPSGMVLVGELIRCKQIESKSGTPFYKHMVIVDNGEDDSTYYVTSSVEIPEANFEAGIKVKFNGVYNNEISFRALNEKSVP